MNSHEEAFVLGFTNITHVACALRGYPTVHLTASRAPSAWTKVTATIQFPYPPQILRKVRHLVASTFSVSGGESVYSYLAGIHGAQCGATYYPHLIVGIDPTSTHRLGEQVGVCRNNPLRVSPYTTVAPRS